MSTQSVLYTGSGWLWMAVDGWPTELTQPAEGREANSGVEWRPIMTAQPR